MGIRRVQRFPLERAELYEAKTSEEIVNEQTYTFMDRGGRKVTLRPGDDANSRTDGGK